MLKYEQEQIHRAQLHSNGPCGGNRLSLGVGPKKQNLAVAVLPAAAGLKEWLYPQLEGLSKIGREKKVALRGRELHEAKGPPWFLEP